MTPATHPPPAPKLDDEQLVDRCQVELPYDASAYEVLVRRHEPVVFRACLHYLGNQLEAEETSQDVFMRVFHGLARFQRKSAFRTWLFRIVQNECATRYAKLKRDHAWRADYAREVQSEAPTALDPEVPVTEPFGGSVEETLRHLGEEDRHILILRYSADLSLQEIAETLDLKLSATKMRLYRAQDRFRALFARRRSDSDQV